MIKHEPNNVNELKNRSQPWRFGRQMPWLINFQLFANFEPFGRIRKNILLELKYIGKSDYCASEMLKFKMILQFKQNIWLN